MSIQIPWSQQLTFEEEGGGVDTARLKENRSSYGDVHKL